MVATGCASAGILGMVIGVTPAAAIAQTPPDEIRITGTVRDFRKSHPDFNVKPALGYGHDASNVSYKIGPDWRPVFEGDGFRVGMEWRNMYSDPIPQHLYLKGNGVVAKDSPSLIDNATIDSFDWTKGPYDKDTNSGPAPTWNIVADIPDITPPSGLPYVNKYERSSGTYTISGSFECHEFVVKDGAEIDIDGHVVIRVNEKLDIINHAEIEILPDSSLTIWAGKDFQITDQSQVNMNTANPTICTILYWGGNSNTFKVQNEADIYATFVSPDADLLLQDNSNFYGLFMGKQLLLQNGAGYHHDGDSSPPDVCGVSLNDTAGFSMGGSTAAVSSADSFDGWFRDDMDVNLSMDHTITLTKNDSGVYEYLDDTFFPVDNLMYGNEGGAHNYNFTFTFGADFEFEACNGMFFEFEGADDAWMFIGDDLALDLGGVIPGTRQHVEIDRMGLADGETYRLRFFYAQRNGTSARFRLRTNLPLQTEADGNVASAGFD